jgi:DNA mismatch repair protein MutL
MGFRGEALSSIASVSQVRMVTAQRGGGAGILVELEAGAVKTLTHAASAPGTSLEVSHLFFNTPARLKFLKSPATEFSHIVTALTRQAMAHPPVRFKLLHNKKTVLDLAPSQGVRERAFQLYGADVADHLVEFSGGRDSVRVEGLLAKPGYTRADKTYQDFYVNGRAIRNVSLNHALYAAYSDLLMRDRHPLAFVFLDMDPSLVDVNVHPAKAEVRFRNQSQVHDLVRDALREGLRGTASARPASPDHPSGADVREAVSDYLRNAGAATGGPDYGHARSFQTEKTNILPSVPSETAPARDQLHSLFDVGRSGTLYPLAQVHDSFMIAQSADGMALIDQHAAHERVLFEKLQDQYASGTVPRQNLLIPVQVELGHAEAALVSDHLPELHRLGFVVEHFGSGTYVIKAVPALMTGGDYGQLLRDILDEMQVHGMSSRLEMIRDEVLSVLACHPAVKVHRKLSLREMEELLRDLFSCRMPHSCPHGRPTVVRFTMQDIKKMFKRV